MKVIIITLSLVLASAVGIFLLNQPNSKEVDDSIHQQENNTLNFTIEEPEEPEKETESVPLPTGEDIIRNFFNLIHTNEVIPALDMLSEEYVPNDDTKQKVGVLFNSFTAIQPLEIKPYRKENWTDATQKYEVTLDAAISLDDEEWVMQKYGWYRGKNKRWIKLTKENNLWKIAVIATAP